MSLRPWTKADVPIGAPLRRHAGQPATTILGCSDAGDLVFSDGPPLTLGAALATAEWKWTTDPAWKPCGVEVP